MTKPVRPPALNALKHGGFSSLEVLPGEDRAEFEKLHQRIIDEFNPSGPLEEDAVLDIAKYLWRKSRLDVYKRAARASKQWALAIAGKDEPGFDLDVGLVRQFQGQSKILLEVLDCYLKQTEALEKVQPFIQVFGWLLEDFVRKDGREIDALPREGTTDLALALIADELTPDNLIKQMELLARLDAMIDRAVRRLMYLKATKQMAGLGSAQEPPAVKSNSGSRKVIEHNETEVRASRRIKARPREGWKFRSGNEIAAN